MTQKPEIISVQSRVSWGYVGNAVAVPVCQALGVHAWPVDTVRLPHHPGHGPVKALRTDADEIAAMLKGVLAKVAPRPLVLMGYLGTAVQGVAVLETAGDAATLCIDPAFGDTAEGIYVDPAIVAFHKKAHGKADWLLPNAFELSVLTDLPVTSTEQATAAAGVLLKNGTGGVVVTSVPAGGEIANLLITPSGTEIFTVPTLDLRAKGTGDMLSALFCGGLARGLKPADALGEAVEITAIAIQFCAMCHATELDIPEILPKIEARVERARG